MPTDTSWPPVKAIESRADLDSLEGLQAERRAKVKVWAPLAAKFRGAGRGDDSKRKQHRAIMAQTIANELYEKWRNAGAKGDYKAASEAMLERLANSDPRHIEFCETLDKEYIQYVLLENDITELNEKIRSREVELYAYNAESRLAR